MDVVCVLWGGGWGGGGWVGLDLAFIVLPCK